MPDDFDLSNLAGNDLLGRVRILTSEDAIHKAIGRGVSQAVTDRLFTVNRERPNALGGKRTNFYGQAARSTGFRLLPGEVQIFVAGPAGIRLRIKGGEVTPGKNVSSYSGKPTRLLAIPAVTEAYAKKPKEFNNLRLLWSKSKGRPVALVEAPAIKLRKTKGGFKAGGKIGGRVIYWLTDRTVHKPDPSIIPDNVVNQAAKASLNQLLK